MSPIHLAAPGYSPTASDGGGWNRLRVDSITSDQCALMPTDYESLKYDAADTRRAQWGKFGQCFNRGRCRECKMMTATSLSLFGDKALVRVDDNNQPWTMNRPDGGWKEYGEPRSWSFFARLEGWEIGGRFCDNVSRGFWIVRSKSGEGEK